MVIGLIILFIALSIADIWTTLKGLRKPGIEEASPIPRYMFNRFGALPTMIVLKALLAGFFIYAVTLNAHGALSIFRWTVVAAMIGASAYVVQNNLRLLRV